MFDDLKPTDMMETAKCELRHPVSNELIKDKEGNVAWIELYPRDSMLGRKIERKLIDKRLKSKAGQITTSTMEDSAVEMLIALTKDWYLVKADGNPAEYECTDEMKRKFYSSEEDAPRWVRNQVDKFVISLENFRKVC